MTVTVEYDAQNQTLAKAIAASAKSILIGEWTKRRDDSKLAAVIQEIKPAIVWGEPIETKGET